jgi:hypothetical protein
LSPTPKAPLRLSIERYATAPGSARAVAGNPRQSRAYSSCATVYQSAADRRPWFDVRSRPPGSRHRVSPMVAGALRPHRCADLSPRCPAEGHKTYRRELAAGEPAPPIDWEPASAQHTGAVRLGEVDVCPRTRESCLVPAHRSFDEVGGGTPALQMGQTPRLTPSGACATLRRL